MKIRNLIFIIAVFFCSCNPQKQIQRIYKLHPELIHDTTIVIRDTIITPKIDTTFIIKDKDIRDSTVTLNVDKSTVNVNKDSDGNLKINLQQHPDTVTIEVPIKVPVVVTETEYVEKEVYKMTKFQNFIYCNGWILLTALSVLYITWIIKRFIK